ncbi:MAG: tetratricopeptide repeat protein [Gammaproteobacteria bacterium]
MKMFVYLLLATFLSACAVNRAPQQQLPPVVDNTTQAAPGSVPDVQAFPLGVPTSGEPVPMGEMQPIPESANSMPSNNTAVIALLDQADIHSQSGENEAASVTLERALRIEPRNARLWSKLAAVRLTQGQAYQAEQLALKSNTLSVKDRLLRIDNWKIIAEARRARKDIAGIKEAEKKIFALESR